MNNLTAILQDAKEEINTKINMVINEKKIPACLMEGILLGAISDIREQKNTELLEEIRSTKEELEKAKKAAKRTLRTEQEQTEEEHPENPEE